MGVLLGGEGEISVRLSPRLPRAFNNIDGGGGEHESFQLLPLLGGGNDVQVFVERPSNTFIIHSQTASSVLFRYCIPFYALCSVGTAAYYKNERYKKMAYKLLETTFFHTTPFSGKDKTPSTWEVRDVDVEGALTYYSRSASCRKNEGEPK